VADRWLKDHRATSPELANAALHLSAIAGDAGFYETLHAAAKAEKDRLDRQRILEAMGAFRDLDLVQRGFRIAMSDEFDPRESIFLIWNASHEPQTREAALRFVEENFDAIVARMPRDYGAILPGIAGSFCDAEHQEVLETFFRPRARKFPGGDRRYAQTLEQVRQCAAFRAKAGPALTAWLKAPAATSAGLHPPD
jgi:ERAP1-like protein